MWWDEPAFPGCRPRPTCRRPRRPSSTRAPASLKAPTSPRAGARPRLLSSSAPRGSTPTGWPMRSTSGSSPASASAGLFHTDLFKAPRRDVRRRARPRNGEGPGPAGAAVGLHLLDAVRRLAPSDFAWLSPAGPDGRYFIDLLAGTDRLRRDIDQGRDPTRSGTNGTPRSKTSCPCASATSSTRRLRRVPLQDRPQATNSEASPHELDDRSARRFGV